MCWFIILIRCDNHFCPPTITLTKQFQYILFNFGSEANNMLIAVFLYMIYKMHFNGCFAPLWKFIAFPSAVNLRFGVPLTFC